MCFKKEKAKPMPAVLAPPEKPAEEEEIGAARKTENERLFGNEGVPRLRTDRSAAGEGILANGTGLRLM